MEKDINQSKEPNIIINMPRKVIDVVVILLLVSLLLLGYSTYNKWSDNIELLKTKPCKLCEDQGHIIINKTNTNKNNELYNITIESITDNK